MPCILGVLGIWVLALLLIGLDAGKKINLTGKLHMLIYQLAAPHFLLLSWMASQYAGKQGVGVFPLILASVPFYFYLVYTFIRLMVFPLQREESGNFRVRVMYGGRTVLCAGVLGVLVQAVFYCFAIPWFLKGTLPLWVIIADTVIALLLLFVVLANGFLRIICTCRRLGAIRRVVIILCVWLPVVNLFLFWYLCRKAAEEYDHECYKVVSQQLRADSMVCSTKYPLLLVHGVGFRDLKYFNYWGRIPKALMKNGAQVYYGHQEAWGTVEDNARDIGEKIREIREQTGCQKVNIIAHSKGGLDARYLISRLGMGEQVASLTTICTPHYGSELVDVLQKLPPKFYLWLCGVINRAFRKVGDKNPDSYSASLQLSTNFAVQFNRETPDDPRVTYQSYATLMKNSFSDSLLSIPHFILRRVKGPNDGLVCVDSAKWGVFCGVLSNRHRRGISHGDIIDLKREDYKGFDVCEFYIGLVSKLKEQGF